MVALLQADGFQDLEEKINHGDGGDLWHSNSTHTVLGPSMSGNIWPNSDAYQDGYVFQTGFWIFEFSKSQEFMNFTVKGLTEGN